MISRVWWFLVNANSYGLSAWDREGPPVHSEIGPLETQSALVKFMKRYEEK